jgi:PPE-repeat protein
MYGYAGAAKAASQVTPFSRPQQATDQGGLAGQSSAITQAAGNARTTMSAVPNALQSLESSTGLTGFDEFSNVYNLASLGSGLLGNGVGLIGLSGAAGFITKTEDKITGDLFGPGEASKPAAPKPSPRAPSVSKATSTVSAEMGESGSLGRLSVPQGWTSAAPQARLAAVESPISNGAPATAGMFSDMPLVGQAPLMAMPGRGSQATDQRAIPARQAAIVATSETKPDEPSSGAATQLREITDVLGKLADLKDKGALTDQEFDEQKHRLLGGR